MFRFHSQIVCSTIRLPRLLLIRLVAKVTSCLALFQFFSRHYCLLISWFEGTNWCFKSAKCHKVIKHQIRFIISETSYKADIWFQIPTKCWITYLYDWSNRIAINPINSNSNSKTLDITIGQSTFCSIYRYIFYHSG